jgi:hypothetical protein
MPQDRDKATLARIDAKLDAIKEMFADHKERFEKHIIDDIVFQKDMMTALAGKENSPGLATRVDRLEQTKHRQDRHFWAIYPALLIGYVLWFFGWK